MSKPKVVVVDDEIEILEIFTHLLSKHYIVFKAINGNDAIKLINKEKPQVVLTDIKMPGMNGVDLLKKAKETSPLTEVIIMTGYASLNTSIEALRAGAFDYLLKPFDSIEKVRKVIEKALDKIKTSKKIKSKQKKLVRRAFELSSAYDISKAVSNFSSYKELLKLIFQFLSKMLDFDTGIGIFYTQSEEELFFTNNISVSEKYIKNLKKLFIKKTKKTFGLKIEFTDNIFKSKNELSDNKIADKINSSIWAPIYVPVVSGEKPVGLVLITSEKNSYFNEEDQKSLNYLADLTGSEINKISSIFSSEQKQIQTFVDILSNGVIMINKNYELVMINPAAREVLNNLNIDLPKKWGSNHCTCNICKSIDKILLNREKIFLQNIEENEFLFSLTSIPLIKDDTSISGVVLILKDLTKEKHLKAQLIQVEKLSSVGQLISGVAHELNNPLTGVLGYAEILMKADIDGDIKNNLAKISTQAERCRRIIQNLLGFVRKHKTEMDPVNINLIASSSISLREYDLKLHNIKSVTTGIAGGLTSPIRA